MPVTDIVRDFLALFAAELSYIYKKGPCDAQPFQLRI